MKLISFVECYQRALDCKFRMPCKMFKRRECSPIHKCSLRAKKYIDTCYITISKGRYSCITLTTRYSFFIILLLICAMKMPNFIRTPTFGFEMVQYSFKAITSHCSKDQYNNSLVNTTKTIMLKINTYLFLHTYNTHLRTSHIFFFGNFSQIEILSPQSHPYNIGCIQRLLINYIFFVQIYWIFIEAKPP